MSMFFPSYALFSLSTSELICNNDIVNIPDCGAVVKNLPIVSSKRDRAILKPLLKLHVDSHNMSYTRSRHNTGVRYLIFGIDWLQFVARVFFLVNNEQANFLKSRGSFLTLHRVLFK